jgi:protease-4
MRQVIGVAMGVVLALASLVGAAGAGFVAGYMVCCGLGRRAAEHVVTGTGPDRIVLVRLVGPIVREGGAFPFGSGVSSREVVTLLDRAQQDPRVRAVVLELNTPGGSVVASAEIHDRVLALRRAGKPVVALLTEVAASGGYYVAASADRIVADPSTITGSIGVIVVLTNVEELQRKLGIRTVVFKSGRFKDMGSPTRPISVEEARIFEGLVQEAYDRFVDVVVRGRHLDRTWVVRLADGRLYTGRQALRLGLVDRLGGRPEAFALARQLAHLAQATVIEYGRPGLVERLLGLVHDAVSSWSVHPGAAPAFSLQYRMVP